LDFQDWRKFGETHKGDGKIQRLGGGASGQITATESPPEKTGMGWETIPKVKGWRKAEIIPFCNACNHKISPPLPSEMFSTSLWLSNGKSF